MIPFPTADGAANVVAYGPSLIIPQTNRLQQLAAWTLLEWLVYPPNQARWVQAVGAYPTRFSTTDLLESAISADPAWAAGIGTAAGRTGRTAAAILERGTLDDGGCAGGIVHIRIRTGANPRLAGRASIKWLPRSITRYVESSRSHPIVTLTVNGTSHYTQLFRGVAQYGSAPRLGRGGRRFESARPDWSNLWQSRSSMASSKRFIMRRMDGWNGYGLMNGAVLPFPTMS